MSAQRRQIVKPAQSKQRSPQAKRDSGVSRRRDRGFLFFCLLAPFFFLVLQFALDDSDFELVREWKIIGETGSRVRQLPHKNLHSETQIKDSWSKTEAQVRAETAPVGQKDEPQGLWIEW